MQPFWNNPALKTVRVNSFVLERRYAALLLSAAPLQVCKAREPSSKPFANLRELNAKTNYYRRAASHSCGFSKIKFKNSSLPQVITKLVIFT